VVLFSGGIAFSFRGGVVPGLRHRRQSGHGTATGAGITLRHGTAKRIGSGTKGGYQATAPSADSPAPEHVLSHSALASMALIGKP